jgi:hypothetical protein
MSEEKTLGDALPKEIERCRELVDLYRSVPNGEFGARMIENDINLAIQAMAENDLPKMIYAYKQLKENRA